MRDWKSKMSYILPTSSELAASMPGGALKIKLSLSLLSDLPPAAPPTVVAKSPVRTQLSSSEGECHLEASEKQHVCRISGCGKSFSDAGSLRKHVMTHGERQFVCPVQSCAKKFLDNSKLRRHMLVHTVVST